MDWVCDDSWKGPFSQSMFFVGAVVGNLVLGFVADKIGRMKAYLISSSILMFAGIATSFFKTFWGFALIRFVQGLSYDSFFTIFYVLCKMLSSLFPVKIIVGIPGQFQAYF